MSTLILLLTLLNLSQFTLATCSCNEGNYAHIDCNDMESFEACAQAQNTLDTLNIEHNLKCYEAILCDNCINGLCQNQDSIDKCVKAQKYDKSISCPKILSEFSSASSLRPWTTLVSL